MTIYLMRIVLDHFILIKNINISGINNTFANDRYEPTYGTDTQSRDAVTALTPTMDDTTPDNNSIDTAKGANTTVTDFAAANRYCCIKDILISVPKQANT